MSSSPLSWKRESLAHVGHGRKRGLEVAVVERRVIREQAEPTVAPEHGRLSHLEVNVARAEFHGMAEVPHSGPRCG
jgi:hypothetical protein